MNHAARNAIVAAAALMWAGAVSAVNVKTAAYDNSAEFDTGVRLDSSQFLAQAFVAAHTLSLTRISISVVNLSQTSETLAVEVRDDAGGIPGNLLATTSLTPTNATAQFIDFDFAPGSVSLSPGTLYYITTANASPASEGYIWDANRVLGGEAGYPEGHAFFSSNQGTSWSPLNSGINNFDLGFQVFGEVIPEPGTSVLLAAGAFGLFLRPSRRGQMKASRNGSVHTPHGLPCRRA